MYTKIVSSTRFNILAGLALALFAQPVTAEEEESDPPEIAIGERLFLETRFAQSYAAKPGVGDPVMQTTQTRDQPLPGPFSGGGINCRACHLVDEHTAAEQGGMRSYADFARLSPQPLRSRDGTPTRPRNAQTLVNNSIVPNRAKLFHHDGQFASLTELVADTLTGREYGWLPGEQDQALAHIASVIRHDDGEGEAARESGGALRVLLKGTAPSIPDTLRLPPVYRIDVETASDKEILAAVTRLVVAYVEDLSFIRDAAGRYQGSPYDRFLAINDLPRMPADGESDRAYSQRLLQAVEELEPPQYVEAGSEAFVFHKQSFVFGHRELAGMKLFFRAATAKARGGNCSACHPAPHFTDFNFHNTGVTQRSYDRVHGEGEFAKLAIPDLAQRRADYDDYLPASENHPGAQGRFRAVASADKPGHTDLGLWNIYANPEFPHPQSVIQGLLCGSDTPDCSETALLPRTIARFKTPGLRDLGHSDPYMHDGSIDRLEEVVAFYRETSLRHRAGELRNGAEELLKTDLQGGDLTALTAFLRSLNEDYE